MQQEGVYLIKYNEYSNNFDNKEKFMEILFRNQNMNKISYNLAYIQDDD